MRRKISKYQNLRQTFDIYSCNINGLRKKLKKKDPFFKDTVIIIANGDDKKGRVLMNLMMKKIATEELWYEGQPFIVCGLAKRKQLQALLISLDKRVAKKLKNFSSLPVVVVDDSKIAIFSLKS